MNWGRFVRWSAAIVAVISLQVALFFLAVGQTRDPLSPGELGDAFGLGSAVFSALGVLLVARTLALQQTALALQQRQLDETKDDVEAQRKAMVRSALAHERIAEINRLTTHVDLCRGELEGMLRSLSDLVRDVSLDSSKSLREQKGWIYLAAGRHRMSLAEQGNPEADWSPVDRAVQRQFTLCLSQDHLLEALERRLMHLESLDPAEAPSDTHTGSSLGTGSAGGATRTVSPGDEPKNTGTTTT